MDISSVFVTGANKGIGLEFVRQFAHLAKPPQYVFATYRNKDKNEALEEIANNSKTCKVVLIKMDVTQEADLKAARKIVEEAVGEKGLTLLINNAGVAAPLPFPSVTPENLRFHFDTNAVGPIMVLQELLPSLQKAAKLSTGPGMSASRAAVLNISSMVGSISEVVNHPPEWLSVAGYRTSKAALNMLTRVAAGVVKEDGILVVCMCPGWVKTDMGTDQALITTKESISTMLDTLSCLNETQHGCFLDRSGNVKEF